MKPAKTLLLLVALLLTTCQKPSRDNPWDTAANINPESVVPGDLSLKHITISKKELSWLYNGDKRIEGFRIDRKQGDEDWWIGMDSLSKEARQWQDTSVLPVDELVYIYRICSYWGNFISDFKTISFTSQSIPQPQNFEVFRESEKMMKLIWYFEHLGVDGFMIDRKIGSEDWKTNFATVPAFTNTFTDTNLFVAEKNIFVEYAVYGFYKNAQGKKSFAVSRVFLQQPTNLTLSLLEGNSIRLDWLDNSLIEEGFKIDRKKNDEQWIVSYATLIENTSNFIDNQSDLNANTYTYRIYAFSGEFESDKTEVKIGKPTLSTTNPTNLTHNSVTTGGNITDDNGQVIVNRGVCWSTSQNPTITNNTTNDGAGSGQFISQITGLIPITTYYTRAYATNAVGTAYGPQITFTTSAGNAPTVATSSVSDITTTSATSGGDVTDQGSTPVSQRGVCWSTNQNPTISNNHSNNGIGTGSFTSQIIGLNDGTTYYVRAYATNAAGTAYGAQLSFTTLVILPTVTTSDTSNVTTNSATSGGKVMAQGSSPVTQRGVCWSTNQNPTINNFKTINGSGIGSFTSQLTGLNSSTTYYIRAYATNATGTAYGDQRSFTTFSDGDVYNPTTGKIWNDRNLGASRVALSSNDALAYGDLYQWGRGTDGHEKRTSSTTSTLSITDITGHGNFIIVNSNPLDWRRPQNNNLWQGVNGTNNPCPPGYRLPTEAEWEAESQSWSINNAAGAFNSLIRLPVAGRRLYNNGTLDGVGSHGHYWSTTVDGTYARVLYFDSGSADMYSNSRAYGYSVRCLKD